MMNEKIKEKNQPKRIKIKKNSNLMNENQIGYKKQIKWHIYILTSRREKIRRIKRSIEAQLLCYHV